MRDGECIFNFIRLRFSGKLNAMMVKSTCR